MNDVLAPVFEDRATRLSSFTDEQRSQLELTANNSKDPEFLDRQFSAMWISRRTGLSHEEVVKNFDGLSRLYFGDGATAAKAYDSISAMYKRGAVSSPSVSETGGEMPTALPASPYSVSGTVISKDLVGSLAAGASRTGYSTIGGISSNLAALYGVKLALARDDPEYAKLLDEDFRMGLDYGTSSIAAQAYSIKSVEDFTQTFGTFDLAGMDRRRGEIRKRMGEIEANVKTSNDALLEAVKKQNPDRALFAEHM